MVACTPAERSAVRLNEDGSVDFVSCDGVRDIVSATATTTLRTAPNRQIEDSSAQSVELDSIDRLEVGRWITFVGLPDDWDRVEIIVEGSDRRDMTYGIGERDQLTVGQWRWAGEGSIIPSGRRCEIRSAQD